MSSKNIVETALPIAEVLSYMHEKELIHRGLRLRSVKTNEESNVCYIADFEMLKPTVSNLTSCGVPLTELIYHSPEVRDPKKTVDHRTDQYMLGCLLFSLAVNKNLEEERKELFVSAQTREDLAKELEVAGHHRDLVELLVKLTRLEAEDRYEDMKAVISNLKRIATKLEAIETSRAMSATAKISLKTDLQEPVAVKPTIVEKLQKIATKENFEKLKKKAKPFMPVAFIVIVLLVLHGLVVLASLELSSPMEHRLAEGAKKMNIVGRIVSINEKENTVVIAKGKKRYDCLLPKSLSVANLRVKDMLLVKGVLQPHEKGEDRVIKCDECTHMAMRL